MSQASRRYRGYQDRTLQAVHEAQPEGKKQQEDVHPVVTFPTLLTIPQVANILCLGKTKVYELIATDGLPVHRFGRAIRVSSLALHQWLEQREREQRVSA